MLSYSRPVRKNGKAPFKVCGVWRLGARYPRGRGRATVEFWQWARPLRSQWPISCPASNGQGIILSMPTRRTSLPIFTYSHTPLKIVPRGAGSLTRTLYRRLLTRQDCGFLIEYAFPHRNQKALRVSFLTSMDREPIRLGESGWVQVRSFDRTQGTLPTGK